MEIKLSNIKAAYEGMVALGNLPISNFAMNYKIGINIAKLKSAAEGYDKSTGCIAVKYSEKDDAGKVRSVMIPNQGLRFQIADTEGYLKEMNELGDGILNDDSLRTLNLSDLGKCFNAIKSADPKAVALNGSLLGSINDFIIDDTTTAQ